MCINVHATFICMWTLNSCNIKCFSRNIVFVYATWLFLSSSWAYFQWFSWEWNMISTQYSAYKMRIPQEKKEKKEFGNSPYLERIDIKWIGKEKQGYRKNSLIQRTSKGLCLGLSRDSSWPSWSLDYLSIPGIFHNKVLCTFSTLQGKASSWPRSQCHSYPANLSALNFLLLFMTFLVLKTAELVYFSNGHP